MLVGGTSVLGRPPVSRSIPKTEVENRSSAASFSTIVMQWTWNLHVNQYHDHGDISNPDPFHNHQHIRQQASAAIHRRSKEK